MTQKKSRVRQLHREQSNQRQISNHLTKQAECPAFAADFVSPSKQFYGVRLHVHSSNEKTKFHRGELSSLQSQTGMFHIANDITQ